MKLTNLTLGFATLAMGIASAASYQLVLTDPIQVGERQLKAGAYTVEFRGDQVLFENNNRRAVAAWAVEEKGSKKFEGTSLEVVDSQLREIHVGGTNLTIKLEDAPPAPVTFTGGGF
jgi:hypothetical protein